MSSNSAMDTKEDVSDDEFVLEATAPQAHVLKLAQLRFQLTLSDEDFSLEEQKAARIEIDQILAENKASFYYQATYEQFAWTQDAALLASFDEANALELQTIKEAKQSAEEQEGTAEIHDAELAKGDFYARIGDIVKAVEQYEVAMKTSLGPGGKIDIMLSLLRLGIAENVCGVEDVEEPLELTRALSSPRKAVALAALDIKPEEVEVKDVKELLNLDTLMERTTGMVEKMGDWERRNKYSMYNSLQLMRARKFKEANINFLKGIATFTATEIFDYDTFTLYTVLTSLITLNRIEYKKKILKAPEILGALDNIPHLRDLAFGMYKCQYQAFFKALSGIAPLLKKNPILSEHIAYLMREIRIVVYTQYLQSYQSVTLQAMASSFGFDADFVDAELSRFIAAGRVTCKIDKVDGSISSHRPDKKTLQYNEIIKTGDALLNRIQNLSKVVG